jgi:antitoxin component YwqK of YwqJK toxin-antitoxin module
MKKGKIAFMLLIFFSIAIQGDTQKKCEKGDRCCKKNGRWLEWNECGIKKSETNYEEGTKQGLYIEWHRNGQKITEGKYLHGKKTGRWLKWDQTGNLLFEEYWKEDRVMRIKDLVHFTEKIFIYYPDGQKKYERECKGDKKHGEWIKWDVNGNKRYEREYKDGMKHGKWKTWDAQGNITGEEIWKNGEIIEKVK